MVFPSQWPRVFLSRLLVWPTWASGNAPKHTCTTVLVIAVCILGVVQWGMVLTFGYVVDDICSHYGLREKQGIMLYNWMNFGMFALAFIPGLCYDKLGGSVSIMIGTIIGSLPMFLQTLWKPKELSWLSTANGLAVSYTFFGLGSGFFNLIGVFAPFTVCSEQHIGRVNALVQVCLSLGMTVQSTTYEIIKFHGGDYIGNYLLYVLLFTWICGLLMAIVLRVSESVVPLSVSVEALNEIPQIFLLENELKRCLLLDPVCTHSCNTQSLVRSGCEKFVTDLRNLSINRTFIFFTVVFFIPMAFQFSFLNFVSDIASDAGASVTTIGVVFGIVSAFGRLLASVALDYTIKHPLGGYITYIVLSLLTFALALLIMAVAEEAEPTTMQLANVAAALGSGGMWGIIPAALRLEFGVENLGLIYGSLSFFIPLSEPLWSSLVEIDTCKGIDCYHRFLFVGFGAMVFTALLGCLMIMYRCTELNRERSGCKDAM